MTTTDSATALGFEHVHEPGTSGWTLLLLHGTGGDEHQLLDVGRQLAPAASLLSPRGKVLEGGVTPRLIRVFDVASSFPNCSSRAFDSVRKTE